MLNSRILTGLIYNGNGTLLRDVWKATGNLKLDVHIIDPRYMPDNIVFDNRFENLKLNASLEVA